MQHAVSKLQQIASTLSKARAGSNQLYVGKITFAIPKPDLDKIKSDLIAFAKSKRIAQYVWENGTHAP